MLSRESQRTAGIILIVLPTVIYGGISLLTLLVAVTLHMHAEGAFLAIVIAECSMAAAGVVLFRKGRWKKQKI